MATIIFATDFSESAQNALIYCSHLADFFKDNLILVHAYTIPFNYAETPVPIFEMDNIKESAQLNIDKELEKVKALFPELCVSGHVQAGETLDIINHVATKNTPRLVVFGTSGKGSDTLFWGSVATKALKTLKYPALAVASDIQWKPISTIAFAADYENDGSKMPLNAIANWVNILKAQLKIVHIEVNNNHFKRPEYLEKALSSLSPQYFEMQSTHFIETINDFLAKQEIDWLIVVPRKYGFLEGLFRKSRTKMLAQGSNVPVLALNEISG